MKKLTYSPLAKITAHILLFIFTAITFASAFYLLSCVRANTYVYDPFLSSESNISLYDSALQSDIANVEVLLDAMYPPRGSEKSITEGDLGKYTPGQNEYTNFRFITVGRNTGKILLSNFPNDRLRDTRNYDNVMGEDCMTTLIVNNPKQDYTIYVGVVQDLPANDEYSAIRQNYLTQRTVVPILILSLLPAFLLLIFLLVGTGRKKDKEGIQLSGFDRLPLEVAALILGLCFTGVLSLSLSFARFNNYSRLDLFFNIIAFVIIYVTAYMVGLTFLASLVKRIKTRTIVKNTLIYKILHLFGRTCLYMAKNMKTGLKVFLLSGTAMAVLDILFVFILTNHSAFALLLLLLGQLFLVLFLTVCAIQFQKVSLGARKISDGDLGYRIDERHLVHDIGLLSASINRVGDGMTAALDERMKSEMMKTELITNVSHDIKTPLTSIINYVDLLKKQNITDPTQKEYLSILDEKSQRLKILIEDLVEASKASTGNLQINWEKLNFLELVLQATGEFSEKFKARDLELIVALPNQPVYISADGRYVWRVVENLLSNALKYSLTHSRVYVNLNVQDDRVRFVIRNISSTPLNFSPDELIERFFRGDLSRNTEGSGLGLSIAKSLTELQNGLFTLEVDGDLFKAIADFSAFDDFLASATAQV